MKKYIVIILLLVNASVFCAQTSQIWTATPTPYNMLTPAQQQAVNIGQQAQKGLPANARLMAFNQLTPAQQQAVRAGLAATQAYMPKAQTAPSPAPASSPMQVAVSNNAANSAADLKAAVARSNTATNRLLQASQTPNPSAPLAPTALTRPSKPLPPTPPTILTRPNKPLSPIPATSAASSTQIAPPTAGIRSRLLSGVKKVGSAALTAGAAVSATGQKLAVFNDPRLQDGRFQRQQTQSTAEIKAGMGSTLKKVFTPQGIRDTQQARVAARTGKSVEEVAAEQRAKKAPKVITKQAKPSAYQAKKVQPVSAGMPKVSVFAKARAKVSGKSKNK